MAIQFTAHTSPRQGSEPLEGLEAVETHTRDAAALLGAVGLWDDADPQGSFVGSCPASEFSRRLCGAGPVDGGTDRLPRRVRELTSLLERATLLEATVVAWS